MSHTTLVIGDSITVGEEWPDRAEAALAALGSTWTVEAAGSRTAAYYVANQGWVQSADWLIIFLGLNDRVLDAVPATFGADMATIIGLVEPDRAFVIIPYDTEQEGDYAWSLYEAQMEALDATTIDLGPVIEGNEATYISGDGVHPNAAGYTLIGDTVAEGIKLARVPSSLAGVQSAWPSLRP